MQCFLRSAGNSDRQSLAELLTSLDLPVEDLPDDVTTFTLAFDGDKLAGSAGMEILGAFGLLRSVAVHPNFRNLGLGQKLYAAAMDQAKKAGVREVWLITNTADRYFENLGFVPQERSSAPPEIAGTAQFEGLCPSTAVVMKKSTAD